MTDTLRIPDRWLQGRALYYERNHGFTADDALVAAAEDWKEQERLASESERLLAEKDAAND